MPDVVVVPRDVERDEHPAAGLPAQVFAVFTGLAARPREGFTLAEEGAPGAQALERLAAVRPFVVARDEDERMPDARKLLLARLEPGVAAGLRRRRAAYIADVHDERQLLGVHAVDHRVEALDLGLVVRRIAQHAEDQRGV